MRTVEDRIAKGFAALQRLSLRAAEVHFRKTLKSCEHADAWSGLGQVYWAKARFSDALDAFVRAVKLAPLNCAHWSNVGLALRDLKIADRAINAFRVSVSLNPLFAPAYNEWGNVLYDLGEFHRALLLYNRALRLDRSRAVVFHNLAMCQLAMGKRARAIEAFNRALAIDPQYQHTLAMLRALGAANNTGGSKTHGRGACAWRRGSPTCKVPRSPNGWTLELVGCS